MSGLVLSLPESGTGDGAVIDVSGGVIGPGSVGANRIAVFDGTSGDQIEDGGQTIAQVIATAVNQATEAVADGEILHAATHAAGGDDVLALDTLGAPTDITTLNASASAHGLLKKLPNVANQFLDGTGVWRDLAVTDIAQADLPFHANTHIEGGVDEMSLDSLGTPRRHYDIERHCERARTVEKAVQRPDPVPRWHRCVERDRAV